ncbi:transcription factor bHLH49-like isoform X1 [Zingiber officinale]|uniref:BHLH domain-containing protein n=2 Tax=Zingiber officinale TaxID=94328 RepID=A0A8J5FP12_ZINOF|nr:transcription factor bHLH49-like isoform X1 [Zingiber officinale]KAG6493063.1 hypothetical protein ZIOFF_048037 [Zingiber officinale]
MRRQRQQGSALIKEGSFGVPDLEEMSSWLVDPGGYFGPALGCMMSSQSANFAASGKPGLVLQRAARGFRLEGENYGLGGSHFELISTCSQPPMGDGFQAEHLESSIQAPWLNGVKSEVKNGELGICREETSMSDPICASGEASLRKRKENDITLPKSVPDEEDCTTKRHRHIENNAEIASQSDGSRNDEQKQGKEGNVEPSEPPKDYIHVRARRGQATDSHSLAERVRREKISQRMKLLQDLVPGCNKVTGKAGMLDEIINYVQSLQRQVEFLSMKLATVSPDIDFNGLMNLQPEDMIQICGHVPSSVYPSLHQNLNSHHQPHINGYGNASSQVGDFWEDDLQSVVQIGMGQSQSFHCGRKKNSQENSRLLK